MTLDLTKPMRWKSDHTPVIVLWSDDNDTFAEWQPPYDEPVRQHMRTEWFSERVENFSPEPVGPEEVWVSLCKQFPGEMPRPYSVHEMRECVPNGVSHAVRYVRADLATTNAARKVRPLTDEECDDLLTKFERGGLGYFKVRPWYEKIMAARGIEVGE